MKHTVIAAAALAALGAAAQTEAPSGGTLRPIVVTPTPGVAQQAFDTPASVDVVTGEQIRNAQLQVNLSEPLARVPGVVALNRQNYAQDLQISIRGYGARSTFGVRGLRLYADGIPATAPDGQGQISHFDLSSAGRLEVLRGPFSSLYGNSSGGVISLFTADGLPGVQAEAGTAFGRYGTDRENLRFAGEVGAWNWNLDAVHFQTDGFREHSAAKRNLVNGKARLQATPDTRVTFVVNAVDMPDVQDPLGLTRQQYETQGPRSVDPAAIAFNTRKSVDQQQAGAIVEHRINEVHSVKLTGWGGQRGTEQFQAIPLGAQAAPRSAGGVIDLQRDYRGLDGQWIARTRAWGGGLTFTAGLYADDLQEHRKGFNNFIGTTLGVKGALRRDEDNRVRSFDQYAQGVWQGERFSFTAGVRHSEVKFESRDNFIAPGNGDDSGSAKHSATTPVLGAVWHASDALNVYASLGRGFETPTFNELAYRPNNAPGLNFGLKPATSKQWEIGVKAEPVTDWRINAALFEARTKDEIAVLSNTGGRSVFQNVGDTRRRGAEVALEGRWAGAWSTYAALTYLDATYRNSFLTCIGVCTAPNTTVPAGNRIPGVPRVTGYAEVAWRHKPWGLETALELRHIGDLPVNDLNTDFASASTVFNFRISATQVVNRWTFREFLRLDNLADKNYVGSVIVNEGNQRYFEPAPGRTWLVGVNALYAF
ncbi:TonB-dependent receptor [Ramlibacter sp. USB13]|uniref:TonB-dependent receptor n=1 Tax=Ramlibacter cellulosilyticus TaxID=2764187 RepID=A0A923MW38_9BURK|nr:TonB-dependent receptor [Ramlibacter cellulosilyticus]MBC5784822.1 TonB-dependent receptor [Ramlibacter cellulosilyticus]